MITLENEFLKAEMDPSSGGDIRSLIVKGTKKNLLLEIAPPKSSILRNEELNCEESFLARYRGGWQLMFPNAGHCSNHNGIFYHYHGSVWDRSWNLVEQGDEYAKIALELDGQSFSILRTMRLSKARFEVQDEILNKSNRKQSVIWGHHPAFSKELLASVSRITIDADRIEILNQDWREDSEPFRLSREIQGSLLIEPQSGVKGSFLGIISGFHNPEEMVKIDCPKLGLSIKMNWSREIFPNAWFWFESVNVTNRFWPEGISTFAIEPCSTSTNMGYAKSSVNQSNFVEFGGFESKSGKLVVEILDLESNDRELVYTEPRMELDYEII